MRILVAEDDPVSRRVLSATLERLGHTVEIAADGLTAWARFIADQPDVLIADWMMPELDGLELCRRIRLLDRPEYTYIAILSVRNRQRDVTLGFQSGADDFITKPFQAEEVLTRLRVAERMLRSRSAEESLQRALTEARESPGGDVIVRSGNRSGRIMLHEGRVAWAHVSDEPGSLAAMLAGEPSITRDDVRAVLEECSETGSSFAEVLVEWGLVDAQRLRDLARAWIAGKIATIAAFPAPSVLFNPESRSFGGDLLFAPHEVLPPALLTSPAEFPPATALTEDAGLLDPLTGDEDVALTQVTRALAIDGALSAAIFDAHTGRCLGARGEELDLDLVWRKLKIAAASDGWDELEDIIVTTRRHLYILRPLAQHPPRSLFVALDRARARLGMVRLALAECTRA